jgi:hypothetical protein
MGAKRKPGPLSTSSDELSHWTRAAKGWVRTQADRATETVNALGQRFSCECKSLIIEILDLLPVKPDSPYTISLLRHYVEGSGAAYDLGEIPEDWQNWIIKATKGKPGKHSNLNPYNSGIFDLRHALGHFDVIVTVQKDDSRLYEIQDTYQFGFTPHDRDQRGRHGFALGQLDENTIHVIEFVLPADEHRNPGGFKEKWEVKKVGKENILYIPQEVLAQNGKPFKVSGKFSVSREQPGKGVTSTPPSSPPAPHHP